jgi:hypothetical protein
MTFIEGELFHDKRRKLIVYKKLSVDWFGRNLDGMYERELFHNKRMNLNVYESFISILLSQRLYDIL